MMTLFYSILFLLLVVELLSVFWRRKHFNHLVAVANTMDIQNKDQLDFLNGMTQSVRDITVPLVMFLIPLKMVFSQANAHNVSMLDQIHKNNKKLFPEFIYTAGKVIFYTSPILSVLFQVYVIVLLLLFTLGSFLVRQRPKLNKNAIIIHSLV